MKTKKCKYCQTEIDAKAKICPNCRKKQGTPTWIIIVIVFFAIGIIASIGNNAETPSSKKNDNSNNESQTKKSNTTSTKDYAQEETVTYKNVDYSIVKVEKTQGNNQFVKPKEGYEYVKVTLKIENHSDKKISYNALDWQMVNADGVEDAWGTYTADDDITLSSGDLDTGGKVEGVLVWEQKIGDNNLRLRYYANTLFDNDYTFQFKLN